MGVHPILREPWAITSEGMEIAVAIGSRDDFFASARERALSARDGKPLENTRSVTIRDAVAEIPISGTMFRHADLLSEISGGVSYAAIRKDLQAALDNPAVSAVLLNIDSPGGEVTGVAELAQAIYEARAVKPIAAYVGGQGCSAAYWLASAVERIVCAPTAQLGSIGVCTSYMDESKANEAKGLRQVDIVSTQSPHKNADPATETGRALVQERLDDLAAVFIDDVARYRGVAAASVAKDFGRGGVLIGANAVKAGMADAVGNFESVLADMSQRGSAANHKRITMAQEAEQLAAYQAFEREVFALSGKSDRAGAIGAIRAMQASHETVVKLTAEVASERAAKRGLEFDALVKQGDADKKITPAMAKDWIPSLRSREDGCEILKSFLASAASVVEKPSDAPRELVQDASAPSPEEYAVAKAFVGDDPEAIRKRIAEVRALNTSKGKV